MNWRNYESENPEDAQICLTEMKHGFISGQYDQASGTFGGYYWRDMEWYATRWVPIEEVKGE